MALCGLCWGKAVNGPLLKHKVLVKEGRGGGADGDSGGMWERARSRWIFIHRELYLKDNGWQSP